MKNVGVGIAIGAAIGDGIGVAMVNLGARIAVVIAIGAAIAGKSGWKVRTPTSFIVLRCGCP